MPLESLLQDRTNTKSDALCHELSSTRMHLLVFLLLDPSLPYTPPAARLY